MTMPRFVVCLLLSVAWTACSRPPAGAPGPTPAGAAAPAARSPIDIEHGRAAERRFYEGSFIVIDASLLSTSQCAGTDASLCRDVPQRVAEFRQARIALVNETLLIEKSGGGGVQWYAYDEASSTTAEAKLALPDARLWKLPGASVSGVRQDVRALRAEDGLRLVVDDLALDLVRKDSPLVASVCPFGSTLLRGRCSAGKPLAQTLGFLLNQPLRCPMDTLRSGPALIHVWPAAPDARGEAALHAVHAAGFLQDLPVVDVRDAEERKCFPTRKDLFTLVVDEGRVVHTDTPTRAHYAERVYESARRALLSHRDRSGLVRERIAIPLNGQVTITGGECGSPSTTVTFERASIIHDVTVRGRFVDVLRITARYHNGSDDASCYPPILWAISDGVIPVEAGPPNADGRTKVPPGRARSTEDSFALSRDTRAVEIRVDASSERFRIDLPDAS